MTTLAEREVTEQTIHQQILATMEAREPGLVHFLNVLRDHANIDSNTTPADVLAHVQTDLELQVITQMITEQRYNVMDQERKLWKFTKTLEREWIAGSLTPSLN